MHRKLACLDSPHACSHVWYAILCSQKKTAVLPYTHLGVRSKCLTVEVGPVGGCFHDLHTSSNLINWIQSTVPKSDSMVWGLGTFESVSLAVSRESTRVRA